MLQALHKVIINGEESAFSADLRNEKRKNYQLASALAIFKPLIVSLTIFHIFTANQINIVAISLPVKIVGPSVFWRLLKFSSF